MVNIIKRTRVLRELLRIRTGPGALILPKEVTKISMEFSRKFWGGHRGARLFWREMLPRIKYRNPAIPMPVTQHMDPDGPSVLRIFTAAADSSSDANPPSNLPTPPSGTPNVQNTLTPDTSPPTHTININSMSELGILDQLIAKTGAQVIEMTPEEKEQWEEIHDFKERSEKDRQEVREKFLKKRHEEKILRIARGEEVA